jgi:hypothetical protein
MAMITAVIVTAGTGAGVAVEVVITYVEQAFDFRRDNREFPRRGFRWR